MIGDTSFKLFFSVVAREKSKWGQVDQEDLRDGAVLLPDRVFPVAFVTSLVLGKFIRGLKDYILVFISKYEGSIRNCVYFCSLSFLCCCWLLGDCFGGPMGPPGPPGPPGFGPPPP
ncbi:hypothetical protein ERO13_D11G267701v2 [Gossypium hirsutum]|uniref:Uncharacterized protein n=1 Tax=Gossypium mustelinum TaxID=34275 RepID=A0A5D2SXJ0_GOSMU|nr:hypothetical protein ERO13_D11G267701v2 [Gossypium hirsutum]TYI57689.1 hypothetical protein E1A91_D11G298800v1 [Gossypium mustelinum]